MRTNLPRVLAVLAAACLVVQVPAPASPSEQLNREQAERRRAQVDDRLEEARTELAETKRQQQDTLARLQRIDDKRSALETELHRLTTELEDAESRLAEAEQALRSTGIQIDRNTDDLAQTKRDLERQREQLRSRARATFMRGGVYYPETVLDIETANDLGVSLQYLRAMVNSDQERAQEIASLERKYEASLERLDGLRDAQDEARAQRAEERDRVADLVAQRREVVAELDGQAAEHRGVLDELESDEAKYAAAIDALEAESDAIERRLADLAAQERSRANSGSDGSAPAAPASSDDFQWPVNGAITSGFGYRTHPVLGSRRLHAGVDFGAPTGTPIVAAADGRVESAGWQGGYGNAVIINHGGGEATLYGHQSRLAVSAGAAVSRGQVIGYVGSTGMSTGPHLHFELRINGVPTDPMPRL